MILMLGKKGERPRTFVALPQTSFTQANSLVSTIPVKQEDNPSFLHPLSALFTYSVAVREVFPCSD